MILRNRMMLGIAVLVGWLGFESGASAQFPSERYRKITAEQVDQGAESADGRRGGPGADVGRERKRRVASGH